MSSFEDEMIEICEDLRDLRGQPDTLILLNHSQDTDLDYEELLTIESGWNLEMSSEGPMIQIVQTETVTAAILREVVAFAIDDLTYKIRGSDKVEPFGEPLIWTFPGLTTGEAFPG